jgi:hypothetical protein
MSSGSSRIVYCPGILVLRPGRRAGRGRLFVSEVRDTAITVKGADAVRAMHDRIYQAWRKALGVSRFDPQDYITLTRLYYHTSGYLEAMGMSLAMHAELSEFYSYIVIRSDMDVLERVEALV